MVLLREEGRRFFQDFALHSELSVLTPKRHQLTVLRRGQLALLPFAGIDPRLLHPMPDCRLRQIQIAAYLPDRLATVPDQTYYFGLVFRCELPPRSLFHADSPRHFRLI